MIIPKTIQKYISNQNLSKWKIETSEGKLYNNIIVIPALNEINNVKKLIGSLSTNSKQYLSETLVLFIVNNTETETIEIIRNNVNLLQYLRNHLFERTGLNIGLIDASTKGKDLPVKNGGVGFARKIGMDLALNFFDYKNTRKKIIICLDADCLVSKNYLESIVDQYNEQQISAAVVEFKHDTPIVDKEKEAIINYELYLRYYILSLQYAGSPFAFPSIGSIITCDVNSYVKVGGMNKRKAGEDFYFLEKLAKISRVKKVANATVIPSSRISERVPFGTGVRIKRFLENSHNEYSLYSSKNFEILKNWLNIFYSSDYEKDANYLMSKARKISPQLYNFLTEQNFVSDWDKVLKNSKTESQINKQKSYWMDGFKTLKLIHFLRDNLNPNKGMFISINELLKMMNIDFRFKTIDKIPSLDVQIKYLNLLRKLT